MTHKTKATGGGRQWENTKHKPEHHSDLLAGGQCVQCGGLLVDCQPGGRFLPDLSRRGYLSTKSSRANFSGGTKRGAGGGIFVLVSSSSSLAQASDCLCRMISSSCVCVSCIGDSVLLVMILPCKAMRRSTSHHGADSDYSDSLALRRCSYFNLRPQASKTHAEKLALGLVNFSCSTLASIPSISSCGNRIFFFADLLFVLPLDIDAPHLNGLYGRTQYSKKSEKLSIDMCAHMILICAHSLGCIAQIKQRPAVLATHAGRLTKPLIGVTIMAGTQHTPRLAHTQTAFVWRFLALSAGESQIIHVTAWTEREARSRCPSGCVAVFAARIRQGETYAQ